MDAEMLKNVTSPFVTTRTTRRVGLGIPLLSAGAQATGGSFDIRSELGKGTAVEAVYVYSNIDRPPLGDFSGTMHSLIVCNPALDFVVSFSYNGEKETLDTREVRAVLGEDIPLDSPDVSSWIAGSLDEVFPPRFSETK
jgi:hypothetical protein